MVFVYISQTPLLDQFISQIGAFGYIGAFIVGVFFVSTFTVVPASVVLFHLAQLDNPYIVAFVAGLGAMIGDQLVYLFIKDKLFEEWRFFFRKLKFNKVKKLFHSPYFAWVLPLFGAIIIASPLPDELGVGLMGASKIKKGQFLFLTFILNTVGILLIVLSSRFFK